MDYKKIISSERLRFAILQALSFVPDSWMLKWQYRIKMGFWPDMKHPQRYTEKLQLYKMYYRNPLLCRCVDKFEVREYVKCKGLERILNTCYGCYDRADEIDFQALPSKFVAKTTGGGGGMNVLIVREKDSKAWPAQSALLNKWASVVAACYGREWAYDGIKGGFAHLARAKQHDDLLLVKVVQNGGFNSSCYHGNVVRNSCANISKTSETAKFCLNLAVATANFYNNLVV